METEALGCWGREHSRNSSSQLHETEENLEELGNKFLYQEFSVHGPETL